MRACAALLVFLFVWQGRGCCKEAVLQGEFQQRFVWKNTKEKFKSTYDFVFSPCGIGRYIEMCIKEMFTIFLATYQPCSRDNGSVHGYPMPGSRSQQIRPSIQTPFIGNVKPDHGERETAALLSLSLPLPVSYIHTPIFNLAHYHQPGSQWEFWA